MNTLTWGMIVCTYNRVDFLVECLKHVLGQTRPPSEVCVVDASDDWEANRDRVKETYADHWERVRLVYEPAKVRSITYQRTQALQAAEADVIISLDDDIYLYPDAAEKVMDVYESDPDERIAMVAALFAHMPPGEDTGQRDEAAAPKAPGLASQLRQLLENQLSLDAHFVPYDAPHEPGELPPGVETTGARVGGLVNGGRTTFRRKFGLQEGWSPLLLRYATHEDSDFSYRMSKHGLLVLQPEALFFHADGNDGRYDRFRSGTIRVLNLMALHRESSSSRLRSSLRLTATFARFAGLYALIDPARKRFSLPNVRAYALGAGLVPFFMFYPFEDFRGWYHEQQKRLYNRG